MARIFIVSIAASLVALWVVTAKADEGYGSSFFYPSSSAASHAPAYPQFYAWPQTNHEPAIGKTLTPPHSVPLQSEAEPDYQYEWQRQPPPPAPYQMTPQQFSHPQQGYFPREGKIEQAPGYEYDFGDGGSYPPMVPMEGAKWATPRRVGLKRGLHAPQPSAHPSGLDTHIGCTHW